MRKNGLWKIKKSQEKYLNPWIRVYEDEVIRPDGKNGICGVVEMPNGVCILPIDKDGRLYLIDQFRYVLEGRNIEVVGGAVGKKGDFLETAKKELREEAGIVAKEFIDLGEIFPLTSVIKTSTKLFLAKDLDFVEADPEPTEQIKLLKFELKEAVKMVMDGEIKHGPSCALILKAKEFLS